MSRRRPVRDGVVLKRSTVDQAQRCPSGGTKVLDDGFCTTYILYHDNGPNGAEMSAVIDRMVEAALKYAEPHAREYVEPAFNGDAEAADSLSSALGNQNRGAFAVDMWAAKVDRQAYRVFLANAWMHSHRHVINTAGTRRTLTAMFRYAQFLIPAEFGETVRVWRGATAVTIDVARTGYSWTTDRETAHRFATRYAGDGRDPLVIVADVPRGDILYYTNERDEKEVVLLKPPVAAIDVSTSTVGA